MASELWVTCYVPEGDNARYIGPESDIRDICANSCVVKHTTPIRVHREYGSVIDWYDIMNRLKCSKMVEVLGQSQSCMLFMLFMLSIEVWKTWCCSCCSLKCGRVGNGNGSGREAWFIYTFRVHQISDLTENLSKR